MNRKQKARRARAQKKSPALIAKQTRGKQRRAEKRAKRSKLLAGGAAAGLSLLGGTKLGTTLSAILGTTQAPPSPPEYAMDLPASNGVESGSGTQESSGGGIPPLLLIGGAGLALLLFLK